MEVSVPELGFVAATRGIGGAGIGLLVASALPPDVRRALGWTLLAIGVLTTVPIAASVISRQRHPENPVLH
jgi:hypothetical protein